MKVWLNYEDYSENGGIMLVAANSAEEAHKAFHEDDRFGYMWYDGDRYYKPQGWELMPMLEAKVDKPQVLLSY